MHKPSKADVLKVSGMSEANDEYKRAVKTAKRARTALAEVAALRKKETS